MGTGPLGYFFSQAAYVTNSLWFPILRRWMLVYNSMLLFRTILSNLFKR